MAGAATAERRLRPADLERMTGCTYRQLDHWCRTLPLCGGREALEGETTRLTFTETEAKAVVALVAMGRHGIVVTQYAKAVVAALAENPDAQWLVLDSNGTLAVTWPDEVVEHLDLTATTVVVPLTFLED